MPLSFVRIISVTTNWNQLCLAFLVCSLFFFSCSSDTDKDGVNDDVDKCPGVYAKTKNGCPVEKEIANIHFYIDNSASMAGYFNNSTEFNTIISDITAKVNKQIRPIDLFFIADSAVKYTKPIQDFSDDIAQTPPAHQKSSQLNKMIRNIVAHTDSNDVSLLVSDCILSFPDEAIRANPEINKQKAESSLKTDIYNAFHDLNTKGIATSVYAFKSKFYGTYYDYHNTRKVLGGESRPFYLWVIADKALLPKFNAKLADISSFKPAQSLDFGLTEEPVTTVDVLTQAEKKGSWTWSKNDRSIEELKPKETGQQFCVAINLDKLPHYAQDINYLQQYIKADGKGCEVTWTVTDKASINKSKIKSIQQKKAFEDATHFILFTIKAMNLPEASLAVSLPLNYDTWYLNWSCMDDTNPDLMSNKTFALEHLINGVREAYETKNKNYIDFSINLKQ